MATMLKSAALSGAAIRPWQYRAQKSIKYCFAAPLVRLSEVLEGKNRSYSTTAGDKPMNNICNSELQKNLRPKEIVSLLDKYVVGQTDAKRAVAIALRNRWRRRQLPEDLRKEIMPRNVLLVGPTGCGKTEVARRMAMLNDAPFIKVEATKFTEVGYHGRDVDKIIMDLMDISMQLTKKRQREIVREQALASLEDKILDLLVGPARTPSSIREKGPIADDASASSSSEATSTSSASSESSGSNLSTISRGRSVGVDRASFREMLRQGELDDQEIEVDVPIPSSNNSRGGNEISFGETGNSSFGVVKITMDSNDVGGKRSSTRRTRLPISEAREVILEAEIEKLLSQIDLQKEAITAVEETGIVFIDEIDKICTSSSALGRSADASAEGVQRDLLPLVEGCSISTKYGNVNTDYILFVASGAFHAVKPSDLLPELQGRLPVRVELKGLTEDDLYSILTEPVTNMIRQQVELLKTEGVELVFEDAAIREIARKAAHLNKSVENIGARRLHTVMERIVEQISFDAAEEGMRGKTVTVNTAVVEERMKEVTQDIDLSRFIL